MKEGKAIEMKMSRYLEIADFVLQTLFDTLPFLRDVFYSFTQSFQQGGVTQSAEQPIIVTNTIHFRLVAKHFVKTFLHFKQEKIQ